MVKKALDDEYFMGLAIQEAKKAKGPKRFGAVIVKDGKVIACGHNTTYETNDPVSCSGINAIMGASKKLKSRMLAECTIYETGEPCLMCAGASLKARISRFVVGFSHDDYVKLDGRIELNPWSKYLKDIVPQGVEVKIGVLRSECMAVMPNPKYR